MASEDWDEAWRCLGAILNLALIVFIGALLIRIASGNF